MRLMKVIAGFLGLSGVAIGALGAHALKHRLAAAGMDDAWQTAVTYHLIHAAALLALSLQDSSTRAADPWRRRAGWFWTLGALFFSGSLYGLALGGPRWLGPITPLGGLALMAGWLCIIASAFRSSKSDPAS